MRNSLNGKVKRISLDMLINLAGSAISMLTLQLGIYPNIAKELSGEMYGEMQSIMSIVFLVSGTLGGTLSTVRLIRDYNYQEIDEDGDFNPMLLVCLISNIIILSTILFFYLQNADSISVILIVLIATLNLTAEYFSVGLRLKLEFKKIFLNQLIGCAGYFVGYLCFRLTRAWQSVFLVAYLFKTVYCIFSTNLIREKFRITSLIKSSAKTFFDLGIAGLLNKSLSYFDKLLLYPLLGGTAVSVYYVANIFGKLVIQVLEPITNVILSYISKQKSISSKLWRIVIPLGACFCGIMYLICIFISKPVINIFYPQWASEAAVLIPVATLSLSVSAFLNIIYPFTLKSVETRNQIYINSSGLIIYVVLTLSSFRKHGLLGCSVSLLSSYIVKMFMMIYMSLRKVKSNE